MASPCSPTTYCRAAETCSGFHIHRVLFRSVMHRKAVPDSSATFDAIVVSERLAAVDVQVVHHQMDGGRRRVVFHETTYHLSELGRRAVGRWPSEMHASFRLYGAENIGRTTSLVLVVSLGDHAGCSRYPRAHVIVQRHRFLIDANQWL